MRRRCEAGRRVFGVLRREVESRTRAATDHEAPCRTLLYGRVPALSERGTRAQDSVRAWSRQSPPNGLVHPGESRCGAHSNLPSVVRTHGCFTWVTWAAG